MYYFGVLLKVENVTLSSTFDNAIFTDERSGCSLYMLVYLVFFFFLHAVFWLSSMFFSFGSGDHKSNMFQGLQRAGSVQKEEGTMVHSSRLLIIAISVCFSFNKTTFTVKAAE
jgi:hypothetical protein